MNNPVSRGHQPQPGAVSLFFILIIMGAVNSAAVAQSDTPAKGEQLPDEFFLIQEGARSGPRTIEFPEDRSLGTLRIRDWPSDDTFLYYREGRNPPRDPWSIIGPARGKVVIPAGKALSLLAGKDWDTDPDEDFSPLAGLRPNDLQALQIRSNTLTDDDLVHLAGLTGLRRFSLHSDSAYEWERCPIKGRGLAHLKGMKRLEVLTFMGIELQGDSLIHIQELSSLRYLYLGSKEMGDEGLEIVSRMPSLEHLVLWTSRITDDGLAYLQALPNLRRLSLPHDTTDAGVAHIAGIKSLTHLNFLSNDLVTNVGFMHLARMRSLRRLVLTRNTRIDGNALAQLKNLPHLEDLDLSLTLVDDRAVDHLLQMKSLKQLSLRATHVSASGYQRLRRGLPNCEIGYYYKP